MRNLITIIIVAFALSGCVALPITFGIAQVGMGFSNGDTSMAPDTECPPPMIVGCEADRGWSAPEPTTPDVPDEPDQCRDDPEEPDGGKHPNAGRGNGPEGDPDEDPGNSGGRNKGGD